MLQKLRVMPFVAYKSKMQKNRVFIKKLRLMIFVCGVRWSNAALHVMHFQYYTKAKFQNDKL